jgi:hypothetical protein
LAEKGQNFEIFQGDTHVVVISVTDANGGVFNLTGYTIRWVVYHPTTHSIILDKSTGSGITVPVSGEIHIDLLPTDTENAIPKVYNHECEIQIGTNNVHTVCVGTVNILYSNA